MRLTADARQATALTIGTWALSVALYLVPYYVFGLQGGTTASVVVGIINVCMAGAVISAGVFKAAHAVRQRNAAARVGMMAGSVIAASALLSLYDVASSIVLERFFAVAETTPSLLTQAAVNFVSVVWPFSLLASAYTILESQKIARERESELASAREAATRAEATASAAQLAALRYQLNPHFLFNTLNAISSLVVTRDYTEADAMLAKLSEFLRATLAADPEGLIPLEHELATLQHYLEIESIRFGDRLEVEFASTPDLHDVMIPSFVLQPLVENAIKYAVAPSRKPVTVRVEAARDGDDLVVMVEDNGRALTGETKSGTGVGLANVRRRLAVLYGERGTLEAVRRERGFIAIMRLPLARRPSPIARVA